VTILSIPTTTHGRVLFEDAAVLPLGLIVAFHGYGQNAEDALDEIRRIPGIDRWHVAAVQALHRFYTRDQQKVVGSWMTRQDRELAIADNVAYVDAVIRQLADRPATLIFLGFSQGASMAYRAALMGSHRAAGIIALGGDIPPEVKSAPAVAWPRVLIGAGTADEWYRARVDGDVAHLTSLGVAHDVVRFDGGHEWTDEFRAAASRFLSHPGA
jgi:predicted esterase